MKLQKIVSRLQKLHPKEIDLSLDRVKNLCAKLGNPQDQIKAISIIGTNGKYSTIQALFAILKEARFKCNIYTSPHIQKINERFFFNNLELDDENLANLFEEIEEANENQPITEISTSPLTTHALRPFEYLVYVGRNDSAKGLPLLIDYFLAYKAKNNSELKLLIVGEDPKQQNDSDSIIYTGYVTESEKLSLIHSSLALVQPSYFESFSIVLCEAWSQKRPVLVQEKNDVLVGQTQRANGGLSFSTYSDFEIAVNYLLSHPEESAQMGAWGHDYVNELYTWESVIRKTELLLSDAVSNFKSSAT